MANYRDTTPIVDTQNTEPGQFSDDPVDTVHNGSMDDCVLQMSTDDPMQDSQPQTTAALVMSVLSVVFCSPMCALAAIFVSWQARLQVLDQKIAHARHSLVIAWILVGLSVLFGAIVWIILIYVFSVH